jgi:short-subunit dehydrogenase
MRLTHAALRGMVPGRKGSIINVSSVAAFANSPGNVSYCATKAWMNVFTEGLAIELRGINSPVRVQALCPGFTITEFHDTLGVDRGNIPGWLWMKADDIVAASLRGLERGDIIVVPGWQYKVLVAFLNSIPASLRRRLGRPFPDKRV